jgi:hypothetical protein
VREIVSRLEGVASAFPERLQFNIDFLLVLVLDGFTATNTLSQAVENYFESSTGPKYSVALRYFSLSDLLNRPSPI